MEVRIQSVDAASAAKISAVMYGIFGVLFGGVLLLLAVLSGDPSAMGAAIAMIVFYPLAAAIGAAIGAVIYNFCAGKVGGVLVTLDRNDAGSTSAGGRYADYPPAADV